MKHSLLFLFFALLLTDVCRGEGIPTKIVLTNPGQTDRTDEAFVLTRSDLSPSPDDALLPALRTADGSYVPSQADDLDGDGRWDELAFVYSLKAGESVTFDLAWLPAEDYPAFTPRTNARYGKMVSPGHIKILPSDCHGKYNLPRGKGYPYQTDGPAWENDKIAFRHYFDGRNVRDVFGKRLPDMVMDTVGILPDGTPGDNYNRMRPWGRDILIAEQSLGLGGLALQRGDTLVRLGVLQSDRTDNVDSTCYTLVTNGPVRSIFCLDFYGWDVGGAKVDVHETITIWAGKQGHENRITTSPLPAGSHLVAGLPTNYNTQPYTLEQAGRFRLLSLHDKQTCDHRWYMGLSLLVKADCYVNAIDVPRRNGRGISTAWCAVLQPDAQGEYRFYCCAAWEVADPRLADRTYYEDLIRAYAGELSEPSKVEVQYTYPNATAKDEAATFLRDFYTEYLRTWTDELPPNVLERQIDSLRKTHCTQRAYERAKEQWGYGFDYLTDDWGGFKISSPQLQVCRDSLSPHAYHITWIADVNVVSPVETEPYFIMLAVDVVRDDDTYKIDRVRSVGKPLDKWEESRKVVFNNRVDTLWLNTFDIDGDGLLDTLSTHFQVLDDTISIRYAWLRNGLEAWHFSYRKYTLGELIDAGDKNTSVSTSLRLATVECVPIDKCGCSPNGSPHAVLAAPRTESRVLPDEDFMQYLQKYRGMLFRFHAIRSFHYYIWYEPWQTFVLYDAPTH